MISSTTNPIEKKAVIDAIQAVPTSDIDDVLIYASKAFSRDLPERWKSNVIIAINQISKNDRGDVFARVKPFFTYDTDNLWRAKAITCVGKIPLSQRSIVLEETEQFLTPSMEGFERIDILCLVAYLMTRIPANQYNVIIAQVKQQLQTARENHEFTDEYTAAYTAKFLEQALKANHKIS